MGGIRLYAESLANTGGELKEGIRYNFWEKSQQLTYFRIDKA